MRIVGIGYKKGRGKDTLANFMLNHLQLNCDCSVKKIGFADKLKDVAFQLYGWAGLQRGVYYETHYTEKEVVLPKIGRTPRDIWIETGNKLREVHLGTWIDYVINTNHRCEYLLVKDMGFTNEARALREAGGVTIKIDRPGEMATDGRETELDSWTDWDVVVENTGDLEDLYKKAVEICDRHLL